MQQSTDKALPENSKEHLDRKLDHAIKETFPTSDPVSVSITKGSAVDYPEDEPASSRASDWKEMQRRAASQATDFAQEFAHEAAERGRDAWQRARGGYAQAEQYLRRRTRAVQEKPAESLVPVLIGFGIGFAVAWAIQSRQRAEESDAHVSDFARKRTAYMPR